MVFAVDLETRRLVASQSPGDGLEDYDWVAEACRNPACRCLTMTIAFRRRAAGGDGKRPFGNRTYYVYDMIEALGGKVALKPDGKLETLPESEQGKLAGLHYEMLGEISRVRGARGDRTGRLPVKGTLMATLAIMADYFQIYLCDPAHSEDWSALWTDQTVEDRFVALPHTIVFGTGRNMTVPVDVATHAQQPDLSALIAAADHVVCGGITCASGTLKLAGCIDYLPDAFQLEMPKGSIGCAFLSFGLAYIDPVGGLEGDDHYELHVWPESNSLERSVLKRWTEQDKR